MKKNRYEAPKMDTVMIKTRMFLAYSDSRSLPKNDSDSDTDGIDNLDDLL